MVYFPLTWHRPHRKWHLHQCFVAMGTLLSHSLAMIGSTQMDPQTPVSSLQYRLPIIFHRSKGWSHDFLRRFSLLSLFLKNKKIGLCDHLTVCVSPLSTSENLNQTSRNLLCTYIMAPQRISTAYFINPFHLSLCLHVYLSVVATQRLGKHVSAVTKVE
jgi:hypothetical protein